MLGCRKPVCAGPEAPPGSFFLGQAGLGPPLCGKVSLVAGEEGRQVCGVSEVHPKTTSAPAPGVVSPSSEPGPSWGRLSFPTPAPLPQPLWGGVGGGPCPGASPGARLGLGQDGASAPQHAAPPSLSDPPVPASPAHLEPTPSPPRLSPPYQPGWALPSRRLPDGAEPGPEGFPHSRAPPGSPWALSRLLPKVTWL